jgi:hypothetical protein
MCRVAEMAGQAGAAAGILPVRVSRKDLQSDSAARIVT